MKKFDYRYAKILEFKRKNEDSIKNQLSNAMKVLEDEERKLDELKSNKVSTHEDMGQLILNGTSISQLRNYNSFISRLDKSISSRRNAVTEQSSKIEGIRVNLVNTAKEVKVFEKMKDKYVEEYKYEALKEEESLTDQLVTYKSYMGK